MTASKLDDATAGPFWYQPSGSYDAFEDACGFSKAPKEEGFDCRFAREGKDSGQTDKGFELCAGDRCVNAKEKFQWPTLGEKQGQGNALVYIETSAGITQYNSLGSGGNAHSDIYRASAGRLLWMLIDSIPAPEGKSPT